jgi:hypothetical protein
MRIEYTLTPDDWAAFGEYHARTMPQMRRAMRRSLIGGIVLSVAIGAAFWAFAHSSVWLFIGLLYAVFWSWYWPRTFIANVRAHMSRKDRACLRGLHIMESSDKGLRIQCDISDSTMAWIGVQDVIENTSYVFVMFDGLQGCVVPKQRITAGDVGQFLGEVNQLRALRPA